jgi:hypothetical protein
VRAADAWHLLGCLCADSVLELDLCLKGSGNMDIAQHVQAHGGTLQIEKDGGLFIAIKG